MMTKRTKVIKLKTVGYKSLMTRQDFKIFEINDFIILFGKSRVFIFPFLLRRKQYLACIVAF